MTQPTLLDERPPRRATRPLPRDVKAALPGTMRAIGIERHGGPESMALLALPRPVPAASEVLIALHTAGVAVSDAAMRDGWSANGATRFGGGSPTGAWRFPFVPGTEGAGVVVAVGSRVRRFALGQRVYAYDAGGAGFYAEYVAVAEDKVAPLPRSLDIDQAGAFAASGLAALQGIDDALQLRSGESVVIHAAAGAVGSLALQFAKLRGARVFATACGADALALALRLGADAAIDGRQQDIGAALDAFAPEGVDAVLALAGGATLERCLDTLPGGSRLAYPNGIDPEPRPRKRIQRVRYDGVASVAAFERLNRALQYARVQLPIAGVYSLAEAAKAQKRLAAGPVLGQLLLRIHP